MTFQEYIEDILDQQIGLMSEQELEEARKGFEKFNQAAGTRRTKLNDKALEARAVAKLFGGKALNGSKKQKEWAEKIRAEKVREMNEKQAIISCDPAGLLTHSKFWIENRNASGSEIGGFVEQQKAMLKEYKAAKAAGEAGKVAEIAAEYNALTTKWGF